MKIAIIDIGSNSLRLVIYKYQNNEFIPYINHRELLSLAKNMKNDRISDQRLKKAYKVLCDYIEKAQYEGCQIIQPLATYAMRKAENANDLCFPIKEKYGIDIRILSGNEEAKYAYFGILPQVEGRNCFVADLGGGSLELVYGEESEIKQKVSFPFGTLSQSEAFENSADNLAVHIHNHFKGFDLPNEQEEIFLVGGCWRLVGVHELRKVKKKKIVDVHGYRLGVDQRNIALSEINQMSPAELDSEFGQRASLMPYASFLLNILVNAFDLKRVTFSTTGIREGWLYSNIKRN